MELLEDRRFSREPLIRRLGTASCGPHEEIVGELDLLAGEGWPVPEGMVVTREAHRAFLRSSGLVEEMLAHAAGEPLEWALAPSLRRTTSLIEGELNRALCDALIDLGAPSVVVISEGVRKGDLKSIPEVKGAILEAWLSERGLGRQVRAVACGRDIPTWPVLIRREVRPQYTGWSAARGVEAGKTPGEAVVHCAVEAAEDPLPGA
jgi:hypothetical protein